MHGSVHDVMGAYEMEGISLPSDDTQKMENGRITFESTARTLKGEMRLDCVSMLGPDGQPVTDITSGQAVTLVIEGRSSKHFENLHTHVVIREVGWSNEVVLLLSNERDGAMLPVHPGRFEIRLELPFLGLKPSWYLMEVRIRSHDLYMLTYSPSFFFRVDSTQDTLQCNYYQPRSWQTVQVGRGNGNS
jgi:lipopolysaccharide transport system ATP-binding protein